MSTALTIVAIILLGLLIAAVFMIIQLKKLVAKRDQEVVTAKEESERFRVHYESEATRIYDESRTIVDEQLAAIKLESRHVREHYESEARRIQAEADTALSEARAELEGLRKFEGLRDAESETQRVLADALAEATELRQRANALLDESRNAAADERAQAAEKTQEVRLQVVALLGQATRDAERILDEARRRAEQIGGDAYAALRDKEVLEQAAEAMRNVVKGYGDRYVVSTRNVLDQLADDFGHTAAGESLRAARELSRRMIDHGEAAVCDYAEANRRETAIRFVIDAFNGRVDAILSRSRQDNYGTLEREIRDVFSLVNLNGKAFRHARIQPAYLEARLMELKAAVVVHELRLKEREEQRQIKEQMREEAKARREYERAMREAAKEEEMLRKAIAAAEQQVQQASEDQKAMYEKRLEELAEKLEQAEERDRRALSMAQQTKRGHVYIISNIGSLGENVYKIGLTRRLEPLDRIRELGDSSVPFDFDVHALIFSEDAPALENQLHKHFVETQVNKINYRKEFFRLDLKLLRDEIEKQGLTPKWTMTAEAAEYRESLAIEKAIKENPELREAWLNRQLDFEQLNIESEQEPDELPTE